MNNRIEVHGSAQLAWALATREASLGGSPEIEPIHFFLALLQILDDLFHDAAEGLELPADAVSALPELVAEGKRQLGLSDEAITRLRRAIRRSIRPDDDRKPVRMLHRSARSRELFAGAVRLVVEEHAPSLTMVHLLRALRAAPPPDVAAFLSGGSEPAVVSTEELPKPPLPPADTPDVAPPPEPKRPKTPTLDRLGRDLTLLAGAGRLAPVAGREREIKALARYLSRTSKRNVILYGEAGVGKTAVVEGLAQRLAGEEVPDFLRRLRIVQVNVADLVAGTRYRGELETRLQRLIAECSSDPDVVLFLDEIHLAVGAGAASDSPMDVANLLKPALARGDFRCIGATTTEEFERHVKGDKAFLRRFQVLRVDEPSEEAAVEAARLWARRIEGVQGVVFEEEAVRAAVTLSARLIRGRALPDKAIDLLENAAVYVKVSSLSRRAAAPGKEPPRIGRAEISAVLEEQYGISVSGAGVLDPRGAGAALRAELVGQGAAIDALTETLEALSLKGEGAARPLGVFLFTGPTGVGKTFAAECLARALFGPGEGALCRFNMNEFKERHELARLIGAPPGFVGHGTPGALFRFVESRRQGLVLLDEMEKAHGEIQDYFLQIFDKGEATDSRGRPADFRRVMFVMTCNVVEEEAVVGFGAGRGGAEAAPPAAVLQKELREHFRGEFLARVDRVIAFRPLGEGDYGELFDRRLAELARELEGQGVRLEIAPGARAPLRGACSAGGGGARGFLQSFERLLKAPVVAHARAHPDRPAIRGEWDGRRLVLA